MIIYVLIIILFTISFLPQIRRIDKLQSVKTKLSNYRTSSLILLIWIIIGFFTRLDFNQMWGCIISFGKVFDYNNIGFLSISFLLILIARLSNNKKANNILLVIEFALWLFRYGYYKGGYATGFTGEYPLNIVVLYDSIAIYLRLQNIKNINNIRLFKTSWIFAIVIILTSIKIFLLPMPHDIYWETKRTEKKIKESKKLLIGNWSGLVEYDSTWVDTLYTYKLDTISDELKDFFEPDADWILIDSLRKYSLKDMSKSIIKNASVKIDDSLIFKSDLINCNMIFNYYNGGDLNKLENTYFGSFIIVKIGNDSLEIIMTKDIMNNYKYKLKK